VWGSEKRGQPVDEKKLWGGATTLKNRIEMGVQKVIHQQGSLKKKWDQKEENKILKKIVNRA